MPARAILTPRRCWRRRPSQICFGVERERRLPAMFPVLRIRRRAVAFIPAAASPKRNAVSRRPRCARLRPAIRWRAIVRNRSRPLRASPQGRPRAHSCKSGSPFTNAIATPRKSPVSPDDHHRLCALPISVKPIDYTLYELAPPAFADAQVFRMLAEDYIPANPSIAPGRTLQNLAAAGVDAKSIDTVLLSHLHPDHTNGIRAADGTIAFPNAEIMVPAKDWEFWTSDENAAKAQSNEMMKNYFTNVKKTFAGIESKVTKYDWGKEVAPGITSIAPPGHTPGHTSFAVVSGDSKVLIQADVTNIPEFFLRNPDWHVAFDVDGPLAQTTRHKFYDMAVAEKATVIGFHFSFPSIGHVEKDGTKYRLVPVAWNPVI